MQVLELYFSEEFLRSSQMMSQITPLEVEILFHIINLIRRSG